MRVRGSHGARSLRRRRRTFLAACRCLEIISEAARRLDPEVRERLSAVPWKDVIAAGNIYRHDYDRVTEDRVWRTVVESLPLLTAAVKPDVDALD